MQSPLRTDGELIHVRLSGQDFYIPANYFDSPTDPGLDQRDVLLVALLPTLEGRTKENWNEFMRVPGGGRRVRMLISADANAKRMLDSAWQTLAKLSGPYAATGVVYGLHRQSSDKPLSKMDREIYSPDPDPAQSGFIVCSGDRDYPYPGCSHRFIVGAVMVQATYAKTHLPDWRSIQKSITAWLTGLSPPPAMTP